jgi:hypothetical protein
MENTESTGELPQIIKIIIGGLATNVDIITTYDKQYIV